MTAAPGTGLPSGEALTWRPPDTRLVDRPRLRARLDLDAPLTFLRGPRGAGKATLVDQWLRSLGADPHPGVAGPVTSSAVGSRTSVRVARMTVDRELAHADGFWTTLSEVLDAGGAGGPAAVDGSPRLRVARQLRGVATPLVVVVEHAERLIDDQIDADLVDLISRVPAVRLVVCSERRRPMEAWGAIEVGAEVIDFRALCFDHGETTRLLEAHGVAEPAARATDLMESFRGWAGPTVALVAERAGRPEAWLEDLDPDGDRSARFAHQMLARLEPPAFGDFLLRTAVVETLTPRLAASLVADPDVDEHYARLEESGLVDVGPGGSLRVLPRIRRVLLAELGASRPELADELHRTVATGYRAEGDAFGAIVHAHAAGDWGLLAAVLDESWASLVVRHLEELRALLADLPADLGPDAPAVDVVRELFVTFPTDPVGMGALADRQPSLPGGAPLRDVLPPSLTVLIGMRAAHRVTAALAVVEEQRALVEESAEEWSGLAADLRTLMQVQWGLVRMQNADLPGARREFLHAYRTGLDVPEMGYLARNAATNAAMVDALLGDLDSAEGWLAQAAALPRAEGFLRGFVEEWDPLVHALLATERGDVAGAERRLGEYEPRDASHPGWIFEGYVRAHLGLVGDAPAQALAQIERLLVDFAEAMEPGTLPPGLLFGVAADLALRLGKAERARALLDAAGDHPMLRASRARLALAVGDRPTALAEAGAVLATATTGTFRRIDLLLVRALTEPVQRDADAAFAEVVAATRESGAVRSLALVPRERLTSLVARAAGVAGVRDLVDAVASLPEALPAATTVIELSERERLVLAELARTASHQEIARRLFVSVNTVKTQVRSIYRKLGTRTRPETLAAAHDHGFDLGR